MLAMGFVLVDLPCVARRRCIEDVGQQGGSGYLLMLAIVARDSAVRSFGFNGLAIRADENG